MPLLRAAYLVECMESGALTPGCLDSLLTNDPGKCSDLSIILNNCSQATVFVSSTNAVNTLAGSNTATSVVLNSPSISNTFLSSSVSVNAITCNINSMSTIANTNLYLCNVLSNSLGSCCMYASTNAVATLSSSCCSINFGKNCSTFFGCMLSCSGSYQGCWLNAFPWCNTNGITTATNCGNLGYNCNGLNLSCLCVATGSSCLFSCSYNGGVVFVCNTAAGATLPGVIVTAIPGCIPTYTYVANNCLYECCVQNFCCSCTGGGPGVGIGPLRLFCMCGCQYLYSSYQQCSSCGGNLIVMCTSWTAGNVCICCITCTNQCLSNGACVYNMVQSPICDALLAIGYCYCYPTGVYTVSYSPNGYSWCQILCTTCCGSCNNFVFPVMICNSNYAVFTQSGSGCYFYCSGGNACCGCCCNAPYNVMGWTVAPNGTAVMSSIGCNNPVLTTNFITFTCSCCQIPFARQMVIAKAGTTSNVIVAWPNAGSKVAYSNTCGLCWTCSTLPVTSSCWGCLYCIDGLLISANDFACGACSNTGVWSCDGVNWNTFTLPSCDHWAFFQAGSCLKIYASGRCCNNPACPSGCLITNY